MQTPNLATDIFARRSSGGRAGRSAGRGLRGAADEQGGALLAGGLRREQVLEPVADNLASEVEDMDLREGEAAQPLAEGSDDELEDAFDPNRGGATLAGDNLDGDPWQEAEVEVVEEATAKEVAEGVASTMADVALGEDDAGEHAAAEEDDVAEPPQEAPVEPWQSLGPVSQLGYVYNTDCRMVLRIQRGKPKNSVTVNCYLHSRCKLLLTEARCPDDDTLKRWLFEVPAPTPGLPAVEARALAERHMALGKGRWGGKRQR